MKSGIIKFLAVIPLIALFGCSDINMMKKNPDWESASYTISDINSLASTVNKLDNTKDDDCTDEALNAYNIMLGYAENEANFTDYKIYDYYHVNFDSVKGYVIKLLDNDFNSSLAEDSIVTTSDENVIMLSCDEDGSDVKSEIEPKLMAKKWTEDITNEFSASFPQYHINAGYISLNYLCPNVLPENYSDRSDYTHFFKDNFYDSKFTFYDNHVNVMVSAGTKEEDAQKIFEEIKPVMKKYFVTSVKIFAPVSSEAYDMILEEEVLAGNSYDYNDSVEWQKGFKITKE